jgi:signal transduction histidine kinase
MRSRGFARLLPFAVAAVLLLLLAVLATLQYRWIGELSAMERRRMDESLRASANRFADDINAQVTRAFLYLHPISPPVLPSRRQEIIAQRNKWGVSAPMSRIVDKVFYVERNTQSGLELEVLRYGEFVASPWPTELEGVRRRLLTESSRRNPKDVTLIEGNPPVLVMPVISTPNANERAGQGKFAPVPFAWVIVLLDERFLTESFLPDLVRRHFGGAQGPVVQVVDVEDPRKVIFRSDADVPDKFFRSADIRLKVLGVQPHEKLNDLKELWYSPPLFDISIKDERTGRYIPYPQDKYGFRLLALPRENLRRGEGKWLLLVRNREGAVEKAVAAFRRRNLALSVGILTLLAAAAILMVVTTQRAQRLARQQIEFVAGVTHELNTPLTAIRAAGENLADGVVTDLSEAREYGVLIAKEGRRLSNMVAQTLELAGIQSGRKALRPEPLAVEEVFEAVLEDCRLLLEEKRIAVEKDVPADLPPTLADVAAVRRAVRNLIENAARHGGQGGWIGLRARGETPGAVEITVEDRGPGIRKEDLPHLFKPFYRGRDAVANSVPGSGLGLDLVHRIAQAHGGWVSVASEMGQGSAFTLHLLAAEAGA